MGGREGVGGGGGGGGRGGGFQSQTNARYYILHRPDTVGRDHWHIAAMSRLFVGVTFKFCQAQAICTDNSGCRKMQRVMTRPE